MKKYKDITVKQLQEILDSEETDKGKLYKMYSEIKDVRKFNKTTLINSKKYRHNVDLLQILLVEEEMYSVDEVDILIEDFRNRKVVDR